MSKKGCSPDNSACEGLFGRLKNEFFYFQDWIGVSMEEFICRLDAYLRYYNESRIKQSLGWLSPNQYRRSLGVGCVSGPRKCPHPPSHVVIYPLT
jgi:transposase InsO family protein